MTSLWSCCRARHFKRFSRCWQKQSKVICRCIMWLHKKLSELSVPYIINNFVNCCFINQWLQCCVSRKPSFFLRILVSTAYPRFIDSTVRHLLLFTTSILEFNSSKIEWLNHPISTDLRSSWWSSSAVLSSVLLLHSVFTELWLRIAIVV